MKRKIRVEECADLQAIAEVHRRAFGRDGEARLVDALRGTEAWVPELSRVAEQDGALVGHVLLSRIGLEGHLPQPRLLALGPVAVRPDAQRQGIGSLLIRNVLGQAAELGFAGVIVLGHAEYYPRFGFVPASRFGIRSPFEVPDEVSMALELREGALSGTGGTILYPEPWQKV